MCAYSEGGGGSALSCLESSKHCSSSENSLRPHIINVVLYCQGFLQRGGLESPPIPPENLKSAMLRMGLLKT